MNSTRPIVRLFVHKCSGLAYRLSRVLMHLVEIESKGYDAYIEFGLDIKGKIRGRYGNFFREYFRSPVSSLPHSDKIIIITSVEMARAIDKEKDSYIYTNINQLPVIEETPTSLSDTVNKYMTPKGVLKERIDAFNKQHSPVCSVHVRRGDSYGRIPFESCASITKKVESKFPKGKIFLASDSAMVITGMKQKLGTRIVCAPDIIRYDKHNISQQGLHAINLYEGLSNEETRLKRTEEALTDFFLLSMTPTRMYSVSAINGFCKMLNPNQLCHNITKYEGNDSVVAKEMIKLQKKYLFLTRKGHIKKNMELLIEQGDTMHESKELLRKEIEIHQREFNKSIK